MKKILVAGATGYLGRFMVKAFKEHGFKVRVLVRNPGQLSLDGAHGAPKILGSVDEIVQGEITKPETIKGVCDGVDMVFSSVGITRQKDGLSYHDVDYQGNVNLLVEAEFSKVSRFMYIGVFKGKEMYGMLSASKEQFIERLRQSALSSIIVRPTGYFSDMEEFLQMSLKGKVNLIGDGTKLMNPIHGADLADFCVQGLSQENTELNVGGPQIFSHREIARLAFQAVGKEGKVARIPAWMFKAGITSLKWVRPKAYGPLEFLYNALTHDMVAPCFGTRDLLSHFKQTVHHNESQSTELVDAEL